MRNFGAIPSNIKTPVFGKVVPGQLRSAPEAQLKQVFLRPDPMIVFRDDVSMAPPPKYPADTRFTLLYTGLYCNDRTGDRHIFGPSDEPYVITSSVNVVNGENVVRTERHPIGDPDEHYGDVDSGEFRKGPVAACWTGSLPSAELSILTVVMENDEGDPDAYKEEVETIVDAAAAIAAFFNITVAAALKAFAADVILWLIGSGDDEIGTEVVVITPEWVRRYPHTFPVRKFSDTRTVRRPVNLFQWIEEEIVDNTDLDYQFISRHTERGEYVVTYKMIADKKPLTPANLISIDSDREILVVSNL
jgi:hypothetical protein